VFPGFAPADVANRLVSYANHFSQFAIIPVILPDKTHVVFCQNCHVVFVTTLIKKVEFYLRQFHRLISFPLSPMNCPKCESRLTKVVFTKSDATGKYACIRRHVCGVCEHRWYAAQPQAIVLQSVIFPGTKGAVIPVEKYAAIGVG